MDLNKEDNLFHRLLLATKISSALTTEFQDKYIKYISKEKHDNICNPV